MAGPLTIQRFPKGLIEILGMRATGDTPAQLAQDVSGDLDLLDFYLLDRCQDRLITSISIPAVGEINMGTTAGPAPGFIWLVYDLAVRLPTPAAASSIQCVWGIQRTASAMTMIEGLRSPVVLPGDTFDAAKHFEKPLIMRPGDLVGVATRIFTGAPGIATSGRIYFAEIGI